METFALSCDLLGQPGMEMPLQNCLEGSWGTLGANAQGQWRAGCEGPFLLTSKAA